MKCPICGKNSWLYLDGNALMYKCLDVKCGKVTEKEVTTKNKSNINCLILISIVNGCKVL